MLSGRFEDLATCPLVVEAEGAVEGWVHIVGEVLGSGEHHGNVS